MSNAGCGDPRCGADYCRGSQSKVKINSTLTLRDRIAQTMEAHGLGWIDNGKPDARCYCGHRPRLGESWHLACG
jgi:hypothetical protein